MMKISSPSAVRYMLSSAVSFFLEVLVWVLGHGPTYDPCRLGRGPTPGRSRVFEGVVHVAEQHDRIVVDHDHAAVMGGGGDLEQMRGHLATQRLADLVHLELHLAFAVDPDHGGH